jgi:hypothetical protein
VNNNNGDEAASSFKRAPTTGLSATTTSPVMPEKRSRARRALVALANRSRDKFVTRKSQAKQEIAPLSIAEDPFLEDSENNNTSSPTPSSLENNESSAVDANEVLAAVKDMEASIEKACALMQRLKTDGSGGSTKEDLYRSIAQSATKLQRASQGSSPTSDGPALSTDMGSESGHKLENMVERMFHQYSERLIGAVSQSISRSVTPNFRP